MNLLGQINGISPQSSIGEIPEISQSPRSSTPPLPIRIRSVPDLDTPQDPQQDPTPEPDILPDLQQGQHPVLVEYRLSSNIFRTRLLSTGVLLIRESDSYTDLLNKIHSRSGNWERVPIARREKSIAVRWVLGQRMDNDAYDTICGEDVDFSRLVLMMRTRRWRDRLIVVYHAEEPLRRMRIRLRSIERQE